MRYLMRFRSGFRIEHDLDNAGAISQIDENNTAMIPSSMSPPHQHDFLLRIIGSQIAAIMGSFQFGNKFRQKIYLSLVLVIISSAN
jgi:hypothetical protein